MKLILQKIFERKNNIKVDNHVFYKEKIINKIANKIKNNKLLSVAISCFILFSVANFIMIYNFMKILQNI